MTNQVLLVRGDLAGKQTAVNGRVQGLDATTQHLGGLGDGGDVLDREATLPDHLGGAAGSKNPKHTLAGRDHVRWQRDGGHEKAVRQH